VRLCCCQAGISEKSRVSPQGQSLSSASELH
jgi:hypothetical protein